MNFLNKNIAQLIKVSSLLLVFLISNIAYGQASKVKEAITSYQAGKLSQAAKQIDEAIANEETKADAKTWYYRGFIYKDVYNKQEAGNIDSKARVISIESLKKSISLDKEGKYKGECNKLISYLANKYYNDGVSYLNAQKFGAAYKGYKEYLNAMQIVEPGKKDPTASFYAGYCAYMDNKFNAAIEDFEEAVYGKYNDANLYFFLGKAYWETGQKDQSFGILEKGHTLFPDNKDIVLTQINHYLAEDRIKELETKLKKAIKLEKSNTELYFMLALVYEKMSQKDAGKMKDEVVQKAVESYKQILTIEPNNLKANYNLGILYYNIAVTKIQNLDYEDDFITITQIQDECVGIFKQSLPYMQKAYSLNPKKVETVEGLAGIYFALGDVPKSNEYKEKLKELSGKN